MCAPAQRRHPRAVRGGPRGRPGLDSRRMISLNEGGGAPGAPAARTEEWTSAIFAEGGLLETALGLEHRPQQAIMARAVAAAFERDHALLFEAGTGVGKSLAY